MLRGSAVILFFDGAGRITERITASAGGPVSAVEIPAAAWHTISSLESGTVFFEVKQGPYVQPTEMNVAAWAPAEGQAGTGAFVEWYKNSTMGEEPPELP